MNAREREMRPIRAAENVMTGLMCPPETGKAARRRIVMVKLMKIDITRFGVFVSVSYEEITMVSSKNTSSAVPRSSAMDARHT